MLLFIGFIGSSPTAKGQNFGTLGCGTKFDNAIISILDSILAAQPQSIPNQEEEENQLPIEVPITFHVVCEGDENTCLISDTDIDGYIVLLNDYYNKTPIPNIHFYECSPRNYITNSPYWFLTKPEHEQQLAQMNDVLRTINVYFVFSGWDVGYTKPNESLADRVFINLAYDSDPDVDFGLALGHEVGHFFSLIHTHGYGDEEVTDELVNGTNCETAGDRVCDTPADIGEDNLFNISACLYPDPIGKCLLADYYDCVAPSPCDICDINGDYYTPLQDNIMFQWHFKDCCNQFTDGQYQRIVDVGIPYREKVKGQKDVWIRDGYTDVGKEPNSTSDMGDWNDVWDSPDIWNCLYDPECGGHQNPTKKLDNSDNYLRVRVLNHSCANANLTTVDVYWTRARTDELWPLHWVASIDNQINGHPAGGKIGSEDIINFPANSEKILTFNWQPPDPTWYPQLDLDDEEGPMVCFLVIIKSGEFNINKLFPQENDTETRPTFELVYHQNCIATKNAVLLAEPGGEPSNSTGANINTLYINNNSNLASLHNIEVYNYSPFSSQNNLTQFGDIILLMDSMLWQKWATNNFVAQGIAPLSLQKAVITDHTRAVIPNILIAANQGHTVGLSFERNNIAIPTPTTFSYFITHKLANDSTAVPKGGGVFNFDITNSNLSLKKLTKNTSNWQLGHICINDNTYTIATIEVYSVHGTLMVSQSVTPTTVHKALAQLQPGMYILRLTNEQHSICTQKIIIY
ncbi:MAG: zinc-dependent metalloprotease [Chitinophagales bacterium]|jgi:hypothetical protein|nr:T9SS type A sorting domain-containing protein [Sphingobacteriales bacterium]MBP9140126.1 zinc-dependent metalloprotease [Chitinophagales bacterium]MBK6889987.1 T9SS type A sorting domain-containing protein [Sphingobacteriales bacterium]MBK8678163.1 T9SS type A sorting domain-containing protein [Sphingobacteriales bacterium]MBL0248952.1 T9SS type A sorting domain-containing protein [Sphingobacteriales bacterium]